MEKKLIGYTCEVCHGAKITEDAGGLLHFCDGVMLPVYDTDTTGWADRFNDEFGRDTEMTPVLFPYHKKLMAFTERELATQKREIRDSILKDKEMHGCYEGCDCRNRLLKLLDESSSL
jgi:hypothetical protein